MLKDKHLIEYINAKNDANGTVESYKQRAELNLDRTQQGLEKESVETYKNLRKVNKQDSIETTKQNRSQANGSQTKNKMLTISQVFGVQKEKKSSESKTLRSEFIKSGLVKSPHTRTKQAPSSEQQSQIQNKEAGVQESSSSVIRSPRVNGEIPKFVVKSDPHHPHTNQKMVSPKSGAR